MKEQSGKTPEATAGQSPETDLRSEAFTLAPTAMHILDSDGRIVCVNQAWLDLTGLERGEATGRLLTDLLTGGEPSSTGGWRSGPAGGSCMCGDFGLRGRSGDSVRIRSRCAWIRRPEGDLRICVLTEAGNSHDWPRLTATDHCRIVFEHSPIGIYRTGLPPDGRFLSVNPAMARIYGYDSPAQMLTELNDVTNQLYARPDERGALLERLLRDGQVVGCEVRHRRRDGQEIWINGIARLVRDENNTPVCVDGFIEDITARKQAEMRRELDESRLQALYHLSGMFDEPEDSIRNFALEKGVALTGSRYGFIVGLDDESSELVPLAMSDAVRRDCRLECDTDAQAGRLRHISREVLAQGRAVIDNDLRPDGTGCPALPPGHVPIRRRMGVPLLENGRTVLVAHVAGKEEPYDDSDVRQMSLILDGMWRMLRRKQAERALRDAGQAAERASRFKSDFLANMSHEIRTPISNILGMAEMIASTRPKAEHVRPLEMIRTAAKSLICIVNDILDLSKVEAGRLDLRPTRFNLRQACAQVVESFQALALTRGVTLRFAAAAGLPETAYGDADRLTQVLRNLVSNAIRHTRVGRIEVEVRPVEPGDGVGLVEFCVRDTGEGIAPDKLRQLLDRSSRFAGGFPGEGGTGLGLAISRSLVELWGGTLWAESEIGKGSAFHFTIRFSPPPAQGTPVPAADPGPERTDRPVEPAAVSASSSAPPGAPVLKEEGRGQGMAYPSRRILLAEDNEVNRIFLEHFLAEAGHQVRSVQDGAAVVDVYASGGFEVILMDVQMPGVDGVEAARRVRRLEAMAGAPRTPIVALTAYAMKGDRERFMEAGMDGYVSKPVDMDELLRTIAEVSAGRSGVELVEMRELEDRFRGREKLFAEMADLFRDNVRRKLEEIAAALETGDLDRAGKAAHSLIGSCVAVRSKPAVDVSREVASLARSGDLPAVREAFGRMRQMIGEVIAILNRKRM